MRYSGVLRGLIVVVALATSAAAQAPTLTEAQALKWQNLALKAQNIEMQVALLQQAMNQVVTERQAFVAEVEQAHPGYIFNVQTGKLEVKAPKK